MPSHEKRESENLSASVSNPAAVLSAVFAHSPVAMQLYRRDGRCLLTNPAFERLFGMAPPPEYNVLADETLAARDVAGHLQRAFAGEVVSIPAIWYDPQAQSPVTSGRRVAISSTAVPLRNASGEVEHVLLIFEDVTATLLAQRENAALSELVQSTESELRESRAFLARTQEVARIGSWIAGIERDSRMVLSPEAYAVIGIRPETFAGRVQDFLDVVHPDDVDRIVSARTRAANENVPYDVEFRVLIENEEHWLHTRGEVVTHPAGEAKLLGVVQDITERKRAEIKHSELEEQLLHAQKMEAVGQLAGGVAHDFNNILSVILAYSTLEEDDVEPTREDLNVIADAARRATALTRQLLAFSRKQILTPQVTDVNEVVKNLARMFERLLGENVHLRVELKARDARVFVDPAQVEQVLMNLAVNARDAMPGGGTLTIRTECVVLDEASAPVLEGVRPGRHVMLTVMDTGTGMDAATRARIFEPFFTTKGLGRGTGLGLATVYGIVKQSGGNVTVESEVGLGTTFRVRFPLHEEPEVERKPSRAPQRSVDGTETLLLVEDDSWVRGAARTILSRHGYKVLEAPNAEEALERAQDHAGPIHLLVSDVVMPGMSGRELSARLAIKRPELRTLYLSGYADDTVMNHGVLDPGVSLLQKPFTPQRLAEAVREALSKPDLADDGDR